MRRFLLTSFFLVLFSSWSFASGQVATLLTIRRVRITLLQNSDPSKSVIRIDGGNSLFSTLDVCLQKLINEKAASEKLVIEIAPGKYPLMNGVLIHRRTDIEIRGTGTSPNDVVIALPNTYRPKNSHHNESPTRNFSFLMVDASRITFSNFVLDGNAINVSGQRAFGICGLELPKLNSFRFTNIIGKDYSDIFLIAGLALEEKHFQSTLLPSSLYWAKERLRKGGKIPACSGIVQNVDFQHNQLELQNVGVYYAPYAAYQTSHLDLSDWRVGRDQLAKEAVGFTIAHNTFSVSSSFVETSFSPFHSMVKLHYTSGAQIFDNTFKSLNMKRLFLNGGMLNLAAGMINTVVENNHFIFNESSLAKKHAIAVHSGFLTHPWFGIGLEHITPPVEGLSLVANHFLSSQTLEERSEGIRIFNCCVDNKVSLINTIPFCNALDRTPRDRIIVSSYYKPAISMVGTDEKAWLEGKNSSGNDFIQCRMNTKLYFAIINR